MMKNCEQYQARCSTPKIIILVLPHRRLSPFDAHVQRQFPSSLRTGLRSSTNRISLTMDRQAV
jgi:hypothetical protein